MIELAAEDPEITKLHLDEDQQPEWCEDCDMPKATCMCRFVDTLSIRQQHDDKVIQPDTKAVSSLREEEEFDKLIQSASTPSLASLFARGVKDGVIAPQIAGSGGQ